VGIVLLLAGGLIVEQVGAAPGTTRRPTSKWSAFQPELAPKPAASDGGNVPTGSAALTAANQRADQAIGRVQAATGGSGTAAQTPTPRTAALGPRVCPILLEEGAELIAQTNRLIAANPSLAPQLIAIRDRGLARINAELARFGCPTSFG
jgi:hypothetical protein